MTLSTKQQVFISHVMAGDNVYLTGEAGTGKSWIVKLAIEELKKQGKKVIAVAPTGIAANNIGGATIHSTFNILPLRSVRL